MFAVDKLQYVNHILLIMVQNEKIKKLFLPKIGRVKKSAGCSVAFVALLLSGSGSLSAMRYESIKDYPTIVEPENMRQFEENLALSAAPNPLQVLLFMYNEHYGLNDRIRNDGATADESAAILDNYYKSLNDDECRRILMTNYPEALLDVIHLYHTEMPGPLPKYPYRELLGLAQDRMEERLWMDYLSNRRTKPIKIRFLSAAFRNFKNDQMPLLNMLGYRDESGRMFGCSLFGYRNNASSECGIAGCILGDDVNGLINFLNNKTQDEIKETTIPFLIYNDLSTFRLSLFEIAELSGSPKCFRWLLSIIKYNFSQQDLVYALAGGDFSIIHEVMNHHIKEITDPELMLVAFNCIASRDVFQYCTTENKILELRQDLIATCRQDTIFGITINASPLWALAFVDQSILDYYRDALNSALVDSTFNINDFLTLRILLSKGAKVYSSFAFFMSNEVGKCMAMSYCSKVGVKEIIEFLLMLGKIAREDNSKERLHSTFFFRHLRDDEEKIIEWLINHGADINAKDEYGKTPIYYSSSAKMANLLIADGAVIGGQRDKYGKTPLYYAKSVEIAQLFIANGCSVDDCTWFGTTPLHCLLPFDVIEFLLKNGARDCINWKDDDGRTPIFCHTDADIITLLIENGADVNIKDKSGKTVRRYIELASRIYRVRM